MADVRVVALEMVWIRRRAGVLMYRGLARDEAIDQAIDEQMAMADFNLDQEVKQHIRVGRAQ